MREQINNKVEFKDFSSEAFAFIIDWIYTDKFSPLFSENNIDKNLGINLL